MHIGVFCSQFDVAEKYQVAAEAFTRLIAAGKHTLVWGGADVGIMGILARTVHKGGGRTIGVVREPITGMAFADADEMNVVKDAREMNAGLIERSDIIVVLPGGIGTLNELTDVIRMKKNGFSDRLTVIINTDGFYQGLKQQLERMAEEGFLKKEVMDSVYVTDTPEDAMRYIEAHGN